MASTAPGASGTTTVHYKSGPSKAAGLGAKVADDTGRLSWTWKVGQNTTPGRWRIVVEAKAGAQTVSETTYFEVR